MAADNRGAYPVPSGGSFFHDQPLVKQLSLIDLVKILLIIRNGASLKLQAVFSPGTAEPLTGWLAGSEEALQFALQPLKASNQLGQIAEIFNHGDNPHSSQAQVPYRLKHCLPACEPSPPQPFFMLQNVPANAALKKLYTASVYDYLCNLFEWLSIKRPPHFHKGNAQGRDFLLLGRDRKELFLR
jgi:hypothetical protein